MTFARPPYAGSSKKLALAFDIGTTFSGVSYALLDPGMVPEIKSVGRHSMILLTFFGFPNDDLIT